MSYTTRFQAEYDVAWEGSRGYTYPMSSLYPAVLKRWFGECFMDQQIARVVFGTISANHILKDDDVRTLRAWYVFGAPYSGWRPEEYRISDVVRLILKENNHGLYQRYLDYGNVLKPSVK